MKRIARMLTWGLTATVLAGVTTGPAWAQQQSPAAPQSVDVTSPEPSPKAPGIRLERSMPLEQRGTRDNEYYPGYNVKSEHNPAFVQPFVKTIPTSQSSGVKVGLSGWTAPAVPYDIPQAGGGAAFGITLMWFVPVPAPSSPPAPEGTAPR
jgi:hypothetical protein